MSLFDSIISTAGERFGLGDKSGTLLSALLSLMTDQNNGGFAGFLDRFSQAGLGDTAASWISSGVNSELSDEQVESALGSETITEIANQAGVNATTAKSALAYMIPSVVDKLTPDGVVPEEKDLLSKIGDFLSGWGGAAAGAVLGAAGAVGAVASGAADKVGDAAGAVGDAGKAVVGKGVEVAGKGVDMVGDAAGATVDAGKKAVGAVGDAASGALNAVGDVFDGDGDGGGILKWLLPLILLGLLLLLGFWFCSNKTPVAPIGNTNANANKANVNAATPVAVPSVAANASDAEKNKAAEDALKTATDAKSIAAAMNVSTINFASNSFAIPADAKELITTAAEAMKKLPAGETIEVGGHTDNQGNAAGNLKLSQNRADAVRNALIAAGVNKDALTAKGYGDTKSKADNSTDEGRKQNRRIEYTAGSGGAVTGVNTATTTTTNTTNANAKPAAANITTTTTTNANAAKPANATNANK